jgi:hypothetical protein
MDAVISCEMSVHFVIIKIIKNNTLESISSRVETGVKKIKLLY